MQKKYGPDGFQVIGISMDDDATPVREFSQQYKLNYPVAVGDDKLAERYGGVLGLPVNFIIDREGRIYAKHLGATDVSVFDQEVQDLLSQALMRDFYALADRILRFAGGDRACRV